MGKYYKNPTVRLMQKYFKRSHQQDYETHLHGEWEGVKMAEMRQLKMEVKRQMQLHGDYKGCYHKQDIASYSRKSRLGQDEGHEMRNAILRGKQGEIRQSPVFELVLVVNV